MLNGYLLLNKTFLSFSLTFNKVWETYVLFLSLSNFYFHNTKTVVCCYLFLKNAQKILVLYKNGYQF